MGQFYLTIFFLTDKTDPPPPAVPLGRRSDRSTLGQIDARTDGSALVTQFALQHRRAPPCHDHLKWWTGVRRRATITSIGGLGCAAVTKPNLIKCWTRRSVSHALPRSQNGACRPLGQNYPLNPLTDKSDPPTSPRLNGIRLVGQFYLLGPLLTDITDPPLCP